MSSRNAITFDEIAAELDKLGAGGDAPEGLSTLDWAARWNCGTNRARALIKRGVIEGRFTPFNTLQDNIMQPGRKCQTTIYRWNGTGDK